MKYIIDTDPGIDDAIAIMLGIRNKLDVIGFTLANGNIPLDKSENNIKVIQDFLGTNIKMYRSSVNTVSRNKTAEYAHGIDGLGYAVFPKNSRKVEKTFAEDFMIEASKKYKDISIICLGPLTNLANAIRKDKDIVKRIKEVIIMGATYNPTPDSSLYIEFNVSIDPESAKLVFESEFPSIKVVTHEIGVSSFIEKDYMLSLLKSDDLLSRFVGLISYKYMEFSKEHYDTDGLGTPDPTTVASVIDPKIVKFLPFNIEIVARGKNKGECNAYKAIESNIMLSVDMDIKRFRKLFKKTFK